MTNIKLTHQQWKKILEFLRTRSDLYVGKPLTCKHFITGVLWMTRSGAQWRLLPRKYGEWNAVYQRFDRWSKRGIWTAMFEHFASIITLSISGSEAKCSNIAVQIPRSDQRSKRW